MMMMSATIQVPTRPSVADDPRWSRIVARDRTADGHLWYSVETTGVYCRPSCPSRRANPRNVRLHDTLDSARATGFRPCKRCNPDGLSKDRKNAALVARACRIIEASEEEPSLADLAAAVGRSPGHFHRLFKATTGLTPKQYAGGDRARKVRRGLAGGNTVTEAIYDAGFNSSGRFYEKATDMLGMTPTKYRAGGRDEELRFAVGQTSLGALLVASSEKGVAAILLGDDPESLVRSLQDRFPNARLVGADRDYEALVARVVALVERPEIGLDLPLDLRGTAFQRRVWLALQNLRAGETVSYAEVARRIGSPKAVRAVAGACAANNIAIAIPCHRVVRHDGSLSGYAWGVERKRALIDREAQAREPRLAAPGNASGRKPEMNAHASTKAMSAEARAANYDWEALAGELDGYGCAVLPRLLAPEECRTIAALYPDERHFRSHIVMARHGFGKGEYRYFKYPLPELLGGLRSALYPRLAGVANAWNDRMGLDERYPDAHATFLQQCHDAGQERPTPLLLQYVTGDFNCLHQDLYGDLAFPIQVAILLSEPGADFTGGEFVLTEQRPRMQSRVEVVPLQQGDAVAFAVHNRPVRGSKGNYRVNLRHGVSRLRSGMRHTSASSFTMQSDGAPDPLPKAHAMRTAGVGESAVAA